MKIIAEISDIEEKVDLYFGVDKDDIEKPFVLGGCSNDPNLPSIAQWGSASKFGLSNLESIDGLQWKDWRSSLKKLNCEWVIPIIERAKENSNVQSAVSEILVKSGNNGKSS